ncbi:MAG: endonuclease/exonuclease/phosphatase family protein, partial [Bacteroidales bacterium]|nr:endonuclease/exonuclease/phosphatase family protein [Bacteroidales bacterium]
MTHTKPKNRISFLTGLFLLLNGLAVLLLIISYFSVYFNPKNFPIIAFFGLGYPIFLAINLLFIVFWFFIRVRYIFISILFILLGWNHLGRLVQFNPSNEITANGGQIKILSYNIQNFVKENTSTTKYIQDFENQREITNFIAKEKADIICLLEVLYDKENFEQFPVQLGEKFNCQYSYSRNYYQNRKNKIDALVILTHYPIINKGHFEYLDKTIGIYCDILMENDTVRLYNLHLASIHFRREEYDFISDITKQQNQEEFKANTLKVISKMNTAFIKRGHQTNILTAHISKSPYPVIICGDFNDTPSSYAYRKISENLKDAFVESGKGFGITYAGENFPAFRIDFIFYDTRFKSGDFQRHKIPYSDHYPISCSLMID